MKPLCSVALALAIGGSIGCGRTSPTAPSRGAAVLMTSAQRNSPVTLVEVTAGATGTFNYVGQSVSIPGHGTYKAIRFNWYSYSGAPTATAFGNLYLLDREYVGAPGDLNASTAGVLGVAETIDDGQYVFDSKMKVKGGRKYWFYTNTQGAFAFNFYDDTYDGGDMYVSGFPTLPFHLTQSGAKPGVYVDANFRLQADVAN